MKSYFSLTPQPQRQNTCPWSPWGWIPGLSRMARHEGTQVPYFKGISFTYNLCCPLQYFKRSDHDTEHVNAMQIVGLLGCSRNDSKVLAGSGQVRSFLWIRYEVPTVLHSPSPATTEVLRLVYTTPVWVAFLSLTQS